MPIVDEKELLKKVEEKNKLKSGVETKVIGDTTAYVGANKILYSTFGEALESLQNKKTQDEYKSLGLNERGQTKEQAEESEKRAELLKKKDGFLKQASAIDVEIANIGKEKEEKKKKK